MVRMLINQLLFDGFLVFRAKVSPSMEKRSFKPGSRCSHYQPAQNAEVVGHHCAPDVLLKPYPACPGAASEPKGTFEPGDVGFNPGPKLPQPLVDPVALDHLQHTQALLLGKHHVLDALAFSPAQIVL